MLEPVDIWGSSTLTAKEAAFGSHICKPYVRQKHSPTDNLT
ncbi:MULTISPECIES: hypothetical protein [unclassified Pseudomonas]|nr:MULTISPECIES: hypothetical protein [unclassified Pseudomonas]